jgi:hypothetical protein
MCVLALCVMGCSETTGTGGSGGDGGTGGTGGADLCEGVTCADTECRSGGVCDPGDGACDYETVAENGTACSEGECLDGVCAPVGAFPCTEEGIRDAIAQGGGPHFFACDEAARVVTDAEIVVDNDVTLDGEGNLTVDGSEGHRVFAVPEGVTAGIRGVVVTNGRGGPVGGGILNEGTLTLEDCKVSRCIAMAGGDADPFGSGIANGGTLMLIGCAISENKGPGGGIGNWGTLTATNSTVSGNDILNEVDVGIGIFNAGTATLRHTTVSGNTGNGINNDGEGTTMTVAASIIDDVCSDDDAGKVISLGYNIESPDDTCGFDQPTDLVNVSADDLKLGELADNGGPTETHALGGGSVAIDLIPEAECEIESDQRGITRPGTGYGDNCDAGAFERWSGDDPVIECGPTDGVRCLYEFEELNEEIPGRCYNAVCRAIECSDLSTGERCMLAGVEDFEGFCEGGECKDAVSDCTGLGTETPCTGETASLCYEDVCYPTDCTGLEDGTECITFGPMGNAGIITCENGECPQ